ncbi:MAG: 4-phosphoerythronate dehydrogenase PdxB [Gammaproteobacteria bacterium]|nr:4-phosphoerythronate dehydrogenase PdxB [Gammaproteobacteria bacterium]
MNIIADENIPFAQQAFSTLGEVTLLPGRNLSAADVADAELLLVRSVSRVTPSLLRGSKIRFVATATIGFDHIDLDYLQQHNIGFARAPGSNAISAAEYILSSLLVLAERQRFQLRDKTVAIIGCGNVGSRVLKRLQALGVTCLVNDPPRQQQEPNGDFVSLKDALTADIITLHTPLSKEGDFPTHHLLNAERLAHIPSGTILINAARGAVVDNNALLKRMQQQNDLHLIWDCWEGEPQINTELLDYVQIGTPHIAGYSLDGKVRGTEMIYQAACQFLGVAPSWSAEDALPAPIVNGFTLTPSGDWQADLSATVLSAYDVRRDDANMRLIKAQSHDQQRLFFDQLRKQYPERREFAQYQLQLPEAQGELADLLKALDFRV